MSNNARFQSNVAELVGKYMTHCDFHYANLLYQDLVNSLDAVALVYDPPYVITSPNMRSIPLLYFEPQPLRARANGCLGLEDCWQHPQIWAEKFSWAPAILRKPPAIFSVAAGFPPLPHCGVGNYHIPYDPLSSIFRTVQ
jgi:hypothetical protein